MENFNPHKITLKRINGEKLKTINFRQKETIIGSGYTKNKITINAPRISKFHCMISFHNGEIYIKDLRSRKGTYVNDLKIRKTILLENGDRIGLGINPLKFEHKYNPLVYFYKIDNPTTEPSFNTSPASRQPHEDGTRASPLENTQYRKKCKRQGMVLMRRTQNKLAKRAKIQAATGQKKHGMEAVSEKCETFQ